MAVQLPDFTSVGSNPPQAVGGLPSFAPNDAGAKGEETLGKGIEKAGGTIEDFAAYSQIARNKMDRAMADADFTGRIIPLTEQLKTETDPEKITALRGQFQDALANASNAIGDPAAKRLWAAQQQRHVAQGQAEADLRNTAVYRDRYKAGLIGQLNNLSRVGAVASDPTAFDLAQDNIAHTTRAGQDSGTLTAVEAEQYSKSATKQLVDGRARFLANSGDPEGARDFLAQHVDDLDAITMQALEAHIQTKGDQTVALRVINQSLNRPGSAPISGDLPDRIIGTESGGQNVKNPLSSASGPGQFLDSTWLSLARSALPDVAAGKTDAQLLAMKGDAGIAKRMTAAYAQQNADQLASQGLPTDDGAIYLAHFLGPGGASKVLRADPATPMDQLVGPDVLRANPNIAAATAGDVRRLTADRVGAPLPETAIPMTRGQQTLATLPDYLNARAAIQARTDINDRQRKLALDGLTSQFHQETTLYNALDANAKRDLTDRQTANGTNLLARGISGELVDPSQLADWVRMQQITPEAYKAYQAEIARNGKGQDDLSIFNDIDRRARAGEDVSQDIQKAVETGQLKGTTALSLQRAADARKQREGDQIMRANFSSLRTIAGLDAQEHPIVDLKKEALAAQVALWAQAQQEWNRRVLIGREDSNSVLADMAPRYSRPLDDISAFPNPRLGQIQQAADVASVAQSTQAARDAGKLTEAQFQEERELILRYKRIFDAQAVTRDAAKSAADMSNAARGRIEMRDTGRPAAPVGPPGRTVYPHPILTPGSAQDAQ